jgi:uncharacterized membrane protein AbrB (regulator of aidB expression)
MLPMELLHAGLSGLAPEPAPPAQILAGILIGLGFRKDLLPLAALSALVFLGTALALGLPLSRLTGLPLKTLLFALVGVFHTVRVFLLFLLVPLLARLVP